MIRQTQLALLAFAATTVSPVSGHAASSSLKHRDLDGTAVNSTTCNGKSYSYKELAGYGIIPSNATDKFGDTIGGIGSASKCRIMGLKATRAFVEKNNTDILQSPWTRARGRRQMMALVMRGCCGRCRTGAGE